MRQIGVKYHTAETIFKYDGTPIPADEPLILFRGRDRLVLKMLDFYLQLRLETNGSDEAVQLLKQDIETIKNWQKAHPDQTRFPGA